MPSLSLAPGSPFSTGAGTGQSYGGTVAVAFGKAKSPWAAVEVDILAAANDDGTVSLFAVQSSSPSASLQLIGAPVFIGGPRHPPSAVAFSPNDNLLVAADPVGKRLWVFETSLTGLTTLPGSPFLIRTSPWSLAFNTKFSGPGDLLAVANSEGTVSTIIVSTTGLAIWSPPVPAGGALSVAFSLNGQRIATGNADNTGNGNNTVSVFSVGASALAALPASPFTPPRIVPVPPLLVFPTLSTPSPNGLGPWPPPTFVVFHPLSDACIAVVCFGYSAGLFALKPSGSPTSLQYLPTTPFEIFPDYDNFAPPFPGVCPVTAGFAPNGKLLAIGNAPTGDLPPTTAVVALFDVHSNGLKEVGPPGPFFLTGDGLTVTSLAFNRTGNLLATANFYSLKRTVSLFTVN